FTGLNTSGFHIIWVFVKDIVYVFPLLIYVKGLMIRISQAMMRVHGEVLDRIWAEFEYRWDICHVKKEA
ncbi:hypothetical protein Cfor_06043, partial [Coptotermes formosanus]